MLKSVYDLIFVYNIYCKNIKLYKYYLCNKIGFEYLKENYIIIDNRCNSDNIIENIIENKYNSIDILFNSLPTKKQCLSYYSLSFMMFVPIVIINFNEYLNINLIVYKNNKYSISGHIILINLILSLFHWSNYKSNSFIQKLDMLFVFISCLCMLYDYFNIENKDNNLNLILITCCFLIILVGELDLFHGIHSKRLNIKYNYSKVSFYIHNIFRIIAFLSVLYLNIFFDNIYNYTILFFYTVSNVILLTYISHYFGDLINTYTDYLYQFKYY